jgi:protein-disulfide isomerase
MKASSLLLFSVVLLSSCAQIGADPSGGPPAPAPTAGVKIAPGARPPSFAVPVDGLPMLGDRTAAVTLVELVDYECPYCARAQETIGALRVKYGRDLRVAVVQNPLPMHGHARDAALFALAADARGDFESVHDGLFARHDAAMLEDPSPRELTQANAALDRSLALVRALHVHGAPMFFVNGRKISGAQPLATFETIVDEELAHARALVAAGVAPDQIYPRILEEARANPATLEAEADEPASYVAEARTIGGAHFLGEAKAPRTIVLFTDFECPYCARLDAKLRAFTEGHRDVRVVLRHRPLPMHPHARLAAKAAIAAEAQGALGAYASVLFEKRSGLEREALIDYAMALGLDVARFERDLDAAGTEQRLVEDETLATKLAVTGTPTSFVDGRRVIGAQPAETFETALTLEAR